MDYLGLPYDSASAHSLPKSCIAVPWRVPKKHPHQFLLRIWMGVGWRVVEWSFVACLANSSKRSPDCLRAPFHVWKGLTFFVVSQKDMDLVERF